jgi:hypothetical protein
MAILDSNKKAVVIVYKDARPLSDVVVSIQAQLPLPWSALEQVLEMPIDEIYVMNSSQEVALVVNTATNTKTV